MTANPAIGFRLDDHYQNLYERCDLNAKELVECALDLKVNRPEIFRRYELEKIESKIKKLEFERDRLLKLGISEESELEYPGYVYFIVDINFKHVKIGYSKDPEKRLKHIQTNSPDRLFLLYRKKGNLATEQKLHELFSEYHIRGEWFTYSEEMTEFIRRSALER